MLDIAGTILNVDERSTRSNTYNEIDDSRSMLEVIEAEKEMEIATKGYEVVDRYTDAILASDDEQIKAVSDVLGVNMVEGYENINLKDKLKNIWEKVKNFIKQMIIKFKKYVAVVVTWIRKNLKLTTYDYLVKAKEKINGKKLEKDELPEDTNKKLRKMMSCIVYVYSKIDGTTVDKFIKDYLLQDLDITIKTVKKSVDNIQNISNSKDVMNSEIYNANFLEDEKMIKENENNDKCKSGTVIAVNFNKILVMDIKDIDSDNLKSIYRTCKFSYGTDKSVNIKAIDSNGLENLINRFKEGMKIADTFLKEADGITKKLFNLMEKLDEESAKTDSNIGKGFIEMIKDVVRSTIEILVFHIGTARTLYKSPEVEYYVSESVKLYK